MQTILITGAAGHLGRAVAATFHERGASLILLDRDAVSLQSAFEGWTNALTLAVDLFDAQQVETGIGQALQHFGRIDTLCHIAGGFRMGEAVHETTPASWDYLMDLNARSLLHVARPLVPHLIERGGGKIVTIGAAAAAKASANMGAYAASKSALIRLTEAMSAELKQKNINVNCILPSIIDTPDNRAAMGDADSSQWVSPQALADVIAFLASDAARAIHGASVPVTGLA